MAPGVTPTAAPAMERWIAALHDDVTAQVEALDGGARCREDRWERPGGGGGVTRVLTDGALFEKAGVNRSAVHGDLSAEAITRLGGEGDGAGRRFFATGLSLVLHPRNPHVPTVHLNVRYFELLDAAGDVVDRWIGGGTDLTPFQPWAEDAADFHRALAALCAGHPVADYAVMKRACDDYFVNAHRDGERRGIGGIFFDGVRPTAAHDLEALRAFADAVGRSLAAAYAPIVARRRETPWGERERHFQLLRRGRYVEFNLVHDRGTLFGLQTAARIESVLMSLPPLAAWDYAPAWSPGSEEVRLLDMLRPRDWVHA